MNELVQKIEAQIEQVEKDLAEFKETGYCSYRLVKLQEEQACDASEELIDIDKNAFEIDRVEEIYVAYDYMEFWLRNKLTNTRIRLSMAREL
jgi:hypothetical protein